MDGDGFKQLNRMRLDNDKPVSEHISKSLDTVFKIIVGDLLDNQGLFVDPSTIRNLHSDLSQWYSDLPDADGLMNILGSTSEDNPICSTAELKDLLINFFPVILETYKNGDRMPEILSLLTKLTHLYFDTTLILMTVNAEEQ